MPNKLLAIDGNSLMHRAYWAMPQMSDGEGRPTNAVYGFFNMLLRVVDEYAPDHVAVMFDVKEQTFRHEAYAEYKAGRQKTPDDLITQFPMLKDALTLAGVKYAEAPGYEADDLLGTLAARAGMETYIFTGDRDELQLISPTTSVVLTKKGVTETKLMDEAALKEELGITPAQITDLKGLMGDASDNIPGVAGVGEKTALKLLAEYGTVENLYDNIEKLPANKLKEKLEAGRDSAFLSKRLATIDTGAPLKESVAEFKFNGFDMGGFAKMCEKYGFKSLAKRLDLSVPAPKAAERKVISPDEIMLFADAAEFAFLISGEGFAFALDGGTEYLVPRRQTLLDDGYDLAEILKAAAPFFEGRRAVAHDVKKYMHELSAYGVAITDYFDVMLADWVLNPSHPKYDLAGVMGRAGMAPSAAAVWTLAECQRPDIERNELETILYDIELPLLRVLFEMERHGFYVSADELRRLGKEYDAKIGELTQNIYQLAGEPFNIASTQQLADVLFVRLGLPAQKKTKKGWSTDIEVLEALAPKHPIVGLVMEYRSLTKLKGTYIDGLLNLVKSDGYIHTTFLQTAAATGRLSSVEPNLQNIPIKSAMADDIRKAFEAPDGMVIVSADYSQIELRILAHMAGDEAMIRSFQDGEDIHTRTAAEILGKDIADVSKEERGHAKAVNFGIVYGISDFGLARGTGLSRKEAGRYIERYLQRFSGVKRYMDDIKKSAREAGYVRTMFGRIRYLPELSSGNFNIRSAGERFALNTPIQGTAADIIKIAMNRAEQKLRGTGCTLVLQIHDELVVYAPEGEAEKAKEILRACMENAAHLSVPLEVSVAAGKTWLEAK